MEELTLDLRQNRLTVACVRRLGRSIRSMRALVDLDVVLSGNHTLGDNGFRAIVCSVMRHPSLTQLRLETFGCALTSASADLFGQMCRLNSTLQGLR